MLSHLKQNIGSIVDKDFAHIGEDSTVTEGAKQMRDKDAIRNLMTGTIRQSISMIVIYSIASSYAGTYSRSDRLHYCCFIFYLEQNSNFKESQN
jgi:hypothetical protein